MEKPNSLDCFCNDLDKMVRYYAREFDVTYAEVVGALTMKANSLCLELALKTQEQDDGRP